MKQNQRTDRSSFPPLTRALSALTLLVAGLLPGAAAHAFFLHPLENLSASPTISTLNQVTPQAVAVAGDELIVVWTELDPDGIHPELVMLRRTATGWEPLPRRLTEPDGVFSGDAALVADVAGNLHLVWVDQRGGAFAIWAAGLDADAAELIEPQAISDPSRLLMDPAIAVGQGGEVQVAWTAMMTSTYEIQFASWSAADGWSEAVTLSPDDGRASTQADLAVGPDGRVHLVWSDRHAGRSLLRYRVREDGIWRPGIDLAVESASGKQVRPAIGVGATGDLHFVWNERQGARERIFYTAWYADAERPESPIPVGGATSTARVPNLTMGTDGVVHLVWEEARSNSLAERSRMFIIYAQVTHGEVSELRPISREESPLNFTPSLAVDASGGVHFVWQDQSVGAGDIVYRRGGLTFAPGGTGSHNE